MTLLAAGAVGCCLAAPTAQGDPATAGFVSPPSSLVGQEQGTGRNWDPINAAAGTVSGRRASALHDSLTSHVVESPGTPGRLARMTSSAVVLEENPSVDLGDVMRSVVRSTAAAVPWLHLVPAPAAGHRAGRGGVDGGAAVEHARFDDALAARGASTRANAQSSAAPSGDALPQLSRELVEFARELLANPLAWMVALLVAMIAVTVSVVRSSGR